MVPRLCLRTSCPSPENLGTQKWDKQDLPELSLSSGRSYSNYIFTVLDHLSFCPIRTLQSFAIERQQVSTERVEFLHVLKSLLQRLQLRTIIRPFPFLVLVDVPDHGVGVAHRKFVRLFVFVQLLQDGLLF